MNSVHIVLVPGFAGFDALGQMEYFACVTPQFRQWQHGRAAPAVLHYFDNFPTASVVTRAGRLRNYLAKRIARGEFQAGDRLALVGHSTGGLDIRWLLWDLTQPRREAIAADGAKVQPAEILDRICRIVFLSVPHWGTSIADWVRSCLLARVAVIDELRAVVAASQVPLIDSLQSRVAAAVAGLTGIQLLQALQDALRETDAGACHGDPACVAGAHEAASELGLWLRHMAWDFHAIDDLASQAPSGDPRSPAHFTPRMRARERARWGKNIKTKSYATLGKPPADGRSGIVYDWCYRACANGPFDHTVPRDWSRLPCLAAQQAHTGPWYDPERITPGDNDGIVNTASMLWPDAEETVLVVGDHMDIVGHYKLVDMDGAGAGRRYRAYDLLESASGFDDIAFAEVWNGIFTFCA